jgi:hypothetical protein
VPLTAVDSRITAAAFGLCWPDNLVAAARQITVPVEYSMQWNDELIPREAGLVLFDAFDSAEKSLHANIGRHRDVPRFEAESAVRFLLRHLRRPALAPMARTAERLEPEDQQRQTDVVDEQGPGGVIGQIR